MLDGIKQKLLRDRRNLPIALIEQSSMPSSLHFFSVACSVPCHASGEIVVSSEDLPPQLEPVRFVSSQVEIG